MTPSQMTDAEWKAWEELVGLCQTTRYQTVIARVKPILSAHREIVALRKVMEEIDGKYRMLETSIEAVAHLSSKVTEYTNGLLKSVREERAAINAAKGE